MVSSKNATNTQDNENSITSKLNIVIKSLMVLVIPTIIFSNAD